MAKKKVPMDAEMWDRYANTGRMLKEFPIDIVRPLRRKAALFARACVLRSSFWATPHSAAGYPALPRLITMAEEAVRLTGRLVDAPEDRELRRVLDAAWREIEPLTHFGLAAPPEDTSSWMLRAVNYTL